MRYRLFSQLCVMLAIVLCAGTTAASAPAACTQAHCVYLPLVSTPERISISDVEVQGTRYDGLVIVGEVSVTTSTPVYSVTLEVRSYDTQGNLLATVTEANPRLVATLPGQPNPFYFGIGVTDDQDFARAEVRVSGYSRTHPHTFLPVTVNITSYDYRGGTISLAGTLTNEYGVTVEDIRGVAWTKEGDQRQVQSLASRLDPFETIPFSTSIIMVEGFRPGTVIPYKIVAQGVMP
jgi:hypothetical protein